MEQLAHHRATIRCVVAATVGAFIMAIAVLPASARAATTPSLVTNATTELATATIDPGDVIATGWTIRMPGNHPAATVTLSDVSASITTECRTDGSTTGGTIVLHLADASLSFAENDSAWYPTTSASAAAGYQRSRPAPDACPGGVLSPHGKVTYVAHLLSTDTTDEFSMRFHTVDAHPAQGHGGGNASSRSSRGDHNDDEDDGGDTQGNQPPPPPDTDCSSAPQDGSSTSRCSAPWTPRTTALAVSPAAGSPSPGGPPGDGASAGSGGAGGLQGLPVVISLPIPRQVASVTTPTTRSGTVPRSTGGDGGSTPTAVTSPPTPSSSPIDNLLQPVPRLVPAIGGVIANGGALGPWSWLAVLVASGLALLAAIVAGRRAGRTGGT